ncbi:MAG: hypothetical protein ACP5H2_03040 [Solirubrobacteraceae bacterium]
MISRSRKPLQLLAVAVSFGAFLTAPALASAAPTIKWSRSASLVFPQAAYTLDTVACVPSVTSTASTGSSSAGTLVTNTSLLCLAGDTRGGIWASVHPGRGKVAWHRERVDTMLGGRAITGISCPALNLCVAVDANGQVMHSVKPAVAAKDWSKPQRVDAALQPGGGYVGFSAISCPSINLCVAVDNDPSGQVAYTTTPAGPASSWKVVSLGTSVTLDAVSCASVNLCVIGGSERFYSTKPTGGANSWTAIGTLAGSYSNIASLSCAGPRLCLGVGYGDAGTGLSAGTSAIASAGGTWTEAYVGTDPPAPGAGLVDSVACPFTNFCVAVDGASNAYTTTTPVRGNWSAAKPLKPNSQATLSAVSCNQTVCVEVDNRGTATFGEITVGKASVKAGTGTSTTKSSTTATSKSSTTTTTKSSTTTAAA